MKYLSVILRLIVAVIFFQTLFFKFTAAPESVFIFSSLGIEPWGRWFAGGSELVAAILILLPRTQLLGALMALGIMAGALISHIFILGVVVQDDGGLLFGLACVSMLAAAAVVILQRDTLAQYIKLLRGVLKK